MKARCSFRRSGVAGRGRPRAGRSAATTALVLITARLPACASPAHPAASSPPAVVIDGALGEWVDAPVAVEDSAAGSGSAIDFGAVHVLADGEAGYVQVDLSEPVNLQALAAPIRLVLDADGDAGTGADVDGLEGADLVVVFSPAAEAGQPGAGVAVGRPGEAPSATAYDIGLVFAPTHASDRFELRIDRAAVASFADVPVADRWRGRWVAGDPDAEQRTAVFELPLPPPAVPGGGAAGDPLARGEGADVRVVVWNMADRGVIDRPAAFAAVLRALDPDVVLMDELPGGIDDEALREFLERFDGDWRFALSGGGGRQRAAVASRLPLHPAQPLARIDYPDSVRALRPVARLAQTRRDLSTALEDGVSAAGAFVRVADREILFVALDLACCGGLHDPEDRLRRIQAAAIREAAGRAVDERGPAAVVVGGDFNLVGSRIPLEILAAGLDTAGSDLLPVEALQLDGRTATTWRAPGPFPAGRLDWVLHSGSSLEPVRAFVLDVSDIAPEWREHYGVEAAEAERTSDHLPLVVDLRVREN